MAEFGVRVFFVISGYLITSILLAELSRKGSISLSRFYFRRTMRLFPAAYVFVGVMAILATYGIVHLERWDVAFALTYTTDFNNSRAWSVGHLWSLAVEEQFYLVWPLTLRILGPSRAGRFLMGVLVIAPFIRLASPLVDPAFNFFIWSDSLATGCLVALFRQELAANAIYARILNSRWFFMVPAAAVLANYVPSTKLQWLFCATIMNVGIAATMDWAMRHADGIVGRALNYPAVSFLGVLSYSLYLWQQPFLNRSSSRPILRLSAQYCVERGSRDGFVPFDRVALPSTPCGHGACLVQRAREQRPIYKRGPTILTRIEAFWNVGSA